MTMLDRKLWRDLGRMRGQVTTIALVVAAGVGIFVASVSVYQTLLAAQRDAYLAGRFADLFASVKRAPLAVAREVEELDGVVAVSARSSGEVIVDWPESPVPVSGHVTSLPGPADLGQLTLRRGRWPDPNRSDEVLISEGFALANEVLPGDAIAVLLNGRLVELRVTGVALSPEFLFAARPGMPIPDDRFYVVIWMNGKAAAAALGLGGAFNDLAIALAPDANRPEAVDAVNRILDRYGGVGAIEREDQPSHRFLSDELRQQRLTAETVPVIFFGVAAFLLNIAVARIVSAQREQVATLKAMGYPTRPIALHYLKFVAVIVAVGGVVGIAFGDIIGRAMTSSYQDFFRFPELAFRLTPWSAAVSILASLAAAMAGTVSAVMRVVRLPPAEGMRPAAPFAFHRSSIEQLLPHWLRSPRRLLVLRAVAGRPIRSALTIVGVAMALPIVVLGLFWRDAVDHVVTVQFGLIERGNAYVTFPMPRNEQAVSEVARMPGVLKAEGQRIVPVRLRSGHRTVLSAISGLDPGSELNVPRDIMRNVVQIPNEGVVLSRRMAQRLELAAGDLVLVEVLEGRRSRVWARVTALVDPIIGLPIYADRAWLNRLTGNPDVVSAVALYVDPQQIGAMAQAFKAVPALQSLSLRADALDAFMEKVAGLVLFSALILTGFACVIAVGIVYNSVRITLAERGWELASLRVLGFNRGEVSAILLAESAFMIALAIPLGLILSQKTVELLIWAFQNDSFSFPATIAPDTFLGAAGVVVLASAGSALMVRRRIDRLDLIAVLKTRD